MNVNYSKLDEVHGEITVALEEKDYADKVKKQLKEISKNHAEPGFRPGHVPAGLIQKKYGNAVKYDVINREVGDAVFNYIKENNLHVLGNPVPREGQEIDIEGKDFTLTFRVGIAPEFSTHVDKDMHIPYYDIEVTDKMIDEQSDAMRRRFGKQEPGEQTEPNALIKGIMTELDADGNVKEDGIVNESGIVSPQYFKSEDQQKLFADRHVGDQVVFNPWATCDGNPVEISSMLNIDKEEVDQHKGEFRMEIKEIIVLKPAELGKDLYDSVFGADKVHDEKEWREAIRNMISTSLKGDSNYRFSIDAKDAIMKAVGELQLPDDVLKEFLMKQNEALNNENIDQEYVALRPQLEWELVKEAIASQLDIKVEQEDLMNMARMIARQQLAQYGIANLPAESLDKYAGDILKDKRAYEQVVGQTTEMKLFNGIRATVTVDEKKVSVDEFNALFQAPAAE